MQIKRYLLRLYLLLFLLFAANKLWLRPWVLAKEAPWWLDNLLLSLPNFIEAFMGTVNIAAILLWTQQRYPHLWPRWSPQVIYPIAILLAGSYVILQEIKVHNLGGNNTYDPNDLMASVLGLFFTGFLLYRFGLFQSPSSEQ